MKFTSLYEFQYSTALNPQPLFKAALHSHDFIFNLNFQVSPFLFSPLALFLSLSLFISILQFDFFPSTLLNETTLSLRVPAFSKTCVYNRKLFLFILSIGFHFIFLIRVEL